ncbi:MAG TPA: WD40 repeat domain-containing protein, partial [Thermoanaerobaculia bacterium]|nr:WD40 repeat domain-containing protein [Thermoanaerobaculia bacterium]
TAFQEYELWRSRYPGALTAVEEDFGRAMRARAQRQRRRQNLAVAAAMTILAAVAITVGISRHNAVEAARRAEASKLLALAELRLPEDPTEALALATASLDLADSRESRLFALKDLWQAPPALELPFGKAVWIPAFSPDGRWLVAGGYEPDAYVFGDDGRSRALAGHTGGPLWISGRLVLVEDRRRVSVWSSPDFRLERTLEFPGVASGLWGSMLTGIDGRLFFATGIGGKESRPDEYALWRLDPSDGSRVDLGRVPAHPGLEAFGPGGSSLLYARGAALMSRSLPASTGSAETSHGDHPPEITKVLRFGDEVVTLNRAREGRLWTFERGKGSRAEDVPILSGANVAVPVGSRWIGKSLEQAVGLWRRGTWSAARPLVLRRDLSWYEARMDLHPAGDWLVASTDSYTRLTFWPLRTPRPLVVDGMNSSQRLMAFSPDGRWLTTSWAEGPPLRLWPLTPGATAPRTIPIPGLIGFPTAFAFDPAGRFLFCAASTGPNASSVWMVPLDGRPPFELKGFSRAPWINAVAVSPSGRIVAAAYGVGLGDRTLRVWNLETGETRAYPLPVPPSPRGAKADRPDSGGGIVNLAFAAESTIYSAGYGGVRRWDLASGRQEVVVGTGEEYATMAIHPDRGVMATIKSGELAGGSTFAVFHDLGRGTSRELPAFGSDVGSVDLDPTARVLVTAGADGVIRVGRLSGGEPHLLVGHKGGAQAIVSPDRKWIASAGADQTLRLWPMPDLDAPPLHTLPQKDFVAKLKSLTNFRAVRDPKSATGWKIDVGPFPGWKYVPTWEP